MEETFEEKKRRDLVERFGVNKGNRLADEADAPKKATKEKRRKRAYE